jgi:hypothetical protein
MATGSGGGDPSEVITLPDNVIPRFSRSGDVVVVGGAVPVFLLPLVFEEPDPLDCPKAPDANPAVRTTMDKNLSVQQPLMTPSPDEAHE